MGVGGTHTSPTTRRHSKAALGWNPQGTRSRGRLRTTWRRTILEEIRQQGKIWNEVKALAGNRIRWRNFVRPYVPLRNEGKLLLLLILLTRNFNNFVTLASYKFQTPW